MTRRSPTTPPAAMAMITVLVSSPGGPLGGSGVVGDSAECRATSHDITACTHSQNIVLHVTRYNQARLFSH